MRSNPRKVKKPVIKKWCYTPTEESGLSTDDDETTTVAATGDDETTTEAGTEAAAAAGVTEQTDAETEAPSTETTEPETEGGEADPLIDLRAAFNGGGRFQNRRKSRQL